MPIPQTVLDLIQRFEDNLPAYRSAQYNEAQVREEFITPFFAALGWDVYNRQGASEKYKQVVHEAAVRVGGATKAPDYAFRIGGQRVFFVEAKKPAVALKDDPAPAYQLRRYAWSAKLPLSILTDFEELAVYDCRDKPAQSDTAATGRIFYCTYREYPEQWEHLVGIFAPEAITQGAFDRFAETARGKRGTAEVDAAFLAEIEGWRDVLARNIALRNPGLSARDLNYAVQQTIDRIIFLRIAEDRGIEPYQRLLDAAQGDGIYPRLGELFRQADNRYNSGLFHFQPEKDREETPDTFTLGLKIDDKVLKGIVQNLYYPASPYQFDMLPADILGQVYEQFLGRVIRLTPGGYAKVEEKPEVKKAGGVYYTPTYIVDYIVEHTVGALLEGKTPAQVKGSARVAPLRILDPACGSGTFLIQAYQYLLDWYLEQYVAEGVDAHIRTGRLAPPFIPPTGGDRGGEWRLTAEERKAILLRHLYGVDIDPQAVEVTKLSLLLKVLEGETEATLGTQLAMSIAAQDRVLPDLSRNIRCGNSLIGEDYYTAEQLSFGFVDEEMRYRINAFDWEKGFHSAMMAGGFDAVIGNPPYIRIQAMKEYAPQEVEFYKKKYVAASKGNYDIYVIFVEKGLSLLRAGGRLGYILPHKFFNAQYGEPLRRLISEGRHLEQIVHFGDQQVFASATTYTCLLFLDKTGRDEFTMIKVTDLARWREAQIKRSEAAAIAAGRVRESPEGYLETPLEIKAQVPTNRATPSEWNFTIGAGAGLFERLSAMPVKLGDVADIFVGLQTSADKIYILEEESPLMAGYVRVKDQEGKIWALEHQIVKPFLSKITVATYEQSIARHWLIFPYHFQNGKAVLMSAADIARDYPNAWQYLQQNARTLKRRENGKANNAEWYGYIYRKNLTLFDSPKLIVQVISLFGRYAYDDQNLYFTGGGNGPYYGIRWQTPENPHSLHYLQALLSSKLLDFYLYRISSPFRGGYWSYGKRFIEQLPIRPIDFADPADVARHDRMVGLVEQMLDLHRRLPAAKTPQAVRLLQQQIDLTDKAIDALVYELYGLTAEEIALVGGVGSRK